MQSIGDRVKQFITELRRRRVGRVAAAYTVGAWLLIEVADTVLPRLHFPEWTVTALIVAALIGLPVALALAWSFDVVPDRNSVGAAGRVRRWSGVVLAIGIIALGGATSLRILPRYIAAQSKIDSIVVLPFENLSGNPDQEYFAVGMYDAVVGELSQISALRVISRQSALQYEGSRKRVGQIARELNVEGVLDGSVLATESGVQIRVQLIRALPEERQLWSRAFTRDLREVRSMHAEIARSIAQEIQVALTPQEATRLGSARAVDPVTYEAYLKGMYHLQTFTPEGVQTGLGYLHEAVDLNPADPDAYAGLALGYANLGHSPAARPQDWERARAAALRAIALDPNNAEAYAALADVKLYYEWDWEGARQSFLRANELNPNLAMNHYHYAWFLALFDRMDEAIVEHKRAQQLDPLTPLHTAYLGTLYHMQGRYDDAIREAQRALELRGIGAAGLIVLGQAYSAKGMHKEAIAAHEEFARMRPFGRWILARTYVDAGHVDAARRIVAELEAEPPNPWNALGLASVYTVLGDNDRAFHWLAYRPAHAWLPWIRTIDWLSPLRGDPRYHELLREMKLPPPRGDLDRVAKRGA